ncbi:MAG: carbonic anhydrase [Pseudomonadota bacterium]
MHRVKPLPDYFLQRYQAWKATTYTQSQAWFQRLATEGQRPKAMIISCCDSRVNVTSMFLADQGEYFVHRNVANLVPPYEPDGKHHGTSAAVEYAVTALKVAHIIVMGHSGCGGVQGCIDMCAGRAPELKDDTSFVGRWIDILSPKYPQVEDIADPAEQADRMEELAVITSLENLMTYPFVEARMNDGSLSLHGVRTDIGDASLTEFCFDAQRFKSI